MRFKTYILKQVMTEGDVEQTRCFSEDLPVLSIDMRLWRHVGESKGIATFEGCLTCQSKVGHDISISVSSEEHY